MKHNVKVKGNAKSIEKIERYIKSMYFKSIRAGDTHEEAIHKLKDVTLGAINRLSYEDALIDTIDKVSGSVSVVYISFDPESMIHPNRHITLRAYMESPDFRKRIDEADPSTPCIVHALRKCTIILINQPALEKDPTIAKDIIAEISWVEELDKARFKPSRFSELVAKPEETPEEETTAEGVELAPDHTEPGTAETE